MPSTGLQLWKRVKGDIARFHTSPLPDNAVIIFQNSTPGQPQLRTISLEATTTKQTRKLNLTMTMTMTKISPAVLDQLRQRLNVILGIELGGDEITLEIDLYRNRRVELQQWLHHLADIELGFPQALQNVLLSCCPEYVEPDPSFVHTLQQAIDNLRDATTPIAVKRSVQEVIDFLQNYDYNKLCLSYPEEEGLLPLYDAYWIYQYLLAIPVAMIAPMQLVQLTARVPRWGGYFTLAQRHCLQILNDQLIQHPHDELCQRLILATHGSLCAHSTFSKLFGYTNEQHEPALSPISYFAAALQFAKLDTFLNRQTYEMKMIAILVQRFLTEPIPECFKALLKGDLETYHLLLLESHAQLYQQKIATQPTPSVALPETKAVPCAWLEENRERKVKKSNFTLPTTHSTWTLQPQATHCSPDHKACTFVTQSADALFTQVRLERYEYYYTDNDDTKPALRIIWQLSPDVSLDDKSDWGNSIEAAINLSCITEPSSLSLRADRAQIQLDIYPQLPHTLQAIASKLIELNFAWTPAMTQQLIELCPKLPLDAESEQILEATLALATSGTPDIVTQLKQQQYRIANWRQQQLAAGNDPAEIQPTLHLLRATLVATAKQTICPPEALLELCLDEVDYQQINFHTALISTLGRNSDMHGPDICIKLCENDDTLLHNLMVMQPKTAAANQLRYLLMFEGHDDLDIDLSTRILCVLAGLHQGLAFPLAHQPTSLPLALRQSINQQFQLMLQAGQIDSTTLDLSTNNTTDLDNIYQTVCAYLAVIGGLAASHRALAVEFGAPTLTREDKHRVSDYYQMHTCQQVLFRDCRLRPLPARSKAALEQRGLQALKRQFDCVP